MNARSTERLVQELGRDLAPVRRVPPLRLGIAVVGVLAVLAAWFGLPGDGLRPDLASVWRGGGPFTGILLGLVLASTAGCVAALAASVPGRERLLAVAGGLAVLGLGWSAGTAVAAWASGGFAASEIDAGARMCFEYAVWISLLPAAGLGALIFRGWVGRPLITATLALAGGLACGSLAVHLGCPNDAGGHLLIGHVAPPWVAAVLLALPLAFWLSRSAR